MVVLYGTGVSTANRILCVRVWEIGRMVVLYGTGVPTAN